MQFFNISEGTGPYTDACSGEIRGRGERKTYCLTVNDVETTSRVPREGD